VFAPPAAPTISAPANALSRVTVSGGGVAFATVRIYEGGAVIGTVTADASGYWSIGLTLSIGTHTLSARQIDPVSGFVSASSASVVVTVGAQPAPPAITGATTPVATRSSSPVTLTGTGLAGKTITLYDGGTAIGSAVVAANGTWSLTVRLTPGAHTLTATQTVVAGVTSSASSAIVVTVPLAPGGG
jgi:hypothetical protein